MIAVLIVGSLSLSGAGKLFGAYRLLVVLGSDGTTLVDSVVPAMFLIVDPY
ncbi:hypothetical protein FD14_GL002602 [Secundilactobacillus similis DSM 23365 = JCM 2765]|uniref:Uncharacterized protein n=1 Tax=Secundilactobacillus similis DSM 23365 = JCM 2765 TaxID=1423804 RepID=A0A0R2EYR3_9LACO|nr:hypothetical protein FD14_GL002602 [Secundilactobacillus similis DSM 23365 = JCM 2765]